MTDSQVVSARRLWPCIFSFLFLLTSGIGLFHSQPTWADSSFAIEETQERSLIVAWHNRAMAQQARLQLGPYSLKNKPLRHVAAFKHFYSRITLAPEQETATVLRLLRQRDDVAYAEPDGIIKSQSFSVPDSTPAIAYSTPGIAADTTATAPLQLINAERAWLINADCDDSLIAIIDTGIDLQHPALQGALWQNSNETADGIDNDGNQYIDDLYGLNAIGNELDEPVPSPDDDHGHGTHVAGIIAAADGVDGGQVSGLCRQASLMPVKFLPYGSISDAIEGIAYALEMGVRIMNNSWTYGYSSQALLDALASAETQEVLLVAAAGNSGQNIDSRTVLPATAGRVVNNLIAVANAQTDGSRYTGSNYGHSSVDIAAPGVNIRSTWRDSRYMTETGTSMAAPLVSALGALIWQMRPELTAQQVKALILATANPQDDWQGRLVNPAVIDAAAALEYGAAPPTWLFNLDYSESQQRYVVMGSDLSNIAGGVYLVDSLAPDNPVTLSFDVADNNRLYFDLPEATKAAYVYAQTASGETNRLYLQQPIIAPQDIVVRVDNAGALISWNTPPNADRILVERAEPGGLYQPIATLVTPVGSYRDTEATSRSDYRYRLRAVYDYRDPVSGEVKENKSSLVYANADAASWNLLTTVLGTMQQGQEYALQLATRQTPAADAFSLYPGDSLPEGLTLSGSGMLSGQPQTPGEYRFSVRYQRTDGWSELRTYTLEVTAEDAIAGGTVEVDGIDYRLQSEDARRIQLQARYPLADEVDDTGIAVTENGELIELEATLSEGQQALELQLTALPSDFGRVRTVYAQHRTGDWIALGGEQGAQLSHNTLRWAVQQNGAYDWAGNDDTLRLKLWTDYFQPAQISSEDNDLRCFIASAVYDDPEAYQLKALRAFRDQVLLGHPIGEWLVARYYEYSPAVAVWLQAHPQVSEWVRSLLDWLVEWLPGKGK